MEWILKHANRWLIVLLLARLLFGLAYSLVTPLGEAPDEADHHAYAAYIALEHRLPEGAWMTQAKHPPLYHTLAALVAGWAGFDTGFLRANPDVGFTPDASPNFFVHMTAEDWPWRDGPLAMRLARLLSVLAGVGLVAATYALGRELWPDRPAGALAAAAFVAFLPESLFVGGAMNNDTLAALLGTTALWLALRSRKPSHAVVTGIVMGLGLWAKVSVAALWPVVCLAMMARRWDGGPPTADRRRWTMDGGRGVTENRRLTTIDRPWLLGTIAGGVALLVTAPWFLRNWQLYNDWMGWPLVMATIDRRTGAFGLTELVWLARGLFLSFWGKFGGAGHIPLPWPFYALWAGLVGVSALGWLRRIANSRSANSKSANQQIGKSANQQIGKSANQRVGKAADLQRSTFNFQPATRNPKPAIVLLGAPLLTFAWLIAYSRVALGTDQGRLLFPAIAPLALLIVGGWGLGAGRRSSVDDVQGSRLKVQGSRFKVERSSVVNHQSSVVRRLSSIVHRPSSVNSLPPSTFHLPPSAVGGRRSAIVLATWCGLMLTAAAGALVFGLWLPFAPPPSPAAAEVATASQVEQGFGGRLELAAYGWQPANATGNRSLVLYWRVAQPMADDLRTSLRVLDGANELVWEWKRSPGAGRFPTDRWPAGRVVSDAYSVPAEVLARAARLEVGVRPFPEGPWLPIDGAGGGAFLSIPLAEAAVPVAAGADWPADDAGGRFRGFSRLPGLSAKPPESAMPSATSVWQVGRS